MTLYRVGSFDDIGRGELTRVEAAGVSICLSRIDDHVFAIGDTCTHEFASLSEGELYEGSVQCPMHSSLFDLKTGLVTGLPAVEPVPTYPVVVENGSIFVDV